MLGTMRKFSKDALLDAPDNLYADAIRSIDSYIIRARKSTGWHEGLIPLNYGVEPFDGTMHNILSRRRALVKIALPPSKRLPRMDKSLRL